MTDEVTRFDIFKAAIPEMARSLGLVMKSDALPMLELAGVRTSIASISVAMTLHSVGGERPLRLTLTLDHGQLDDTDDDPPSHEEPN